MVGESRRSYLRRAYGEFQGADSTLARLWGRRGFWQVRLRWAVPPAILAAIIIGRLLGFTFEQRSILLVAGFILLYNFIFAVRFALTPEESQRALDQDNLYSLLQVGLDYLAMFLLIFFTGGAASPLIFFFIFHVLFAGILFRPATAYSFATIAAGGMWLLAFLQARGCLPYHAYEFGGRTVTFERDHAQAGVLLLFFSATVLITALAINRIMSRLRERVVNLVEATGHVARLNDQLASLYAMMRAVGSTPRLQEVLDIVTAELAAVMKVRVIGVKMLSEDGLSLRFVAVHGVLASLLKDKVVQLSQSPINQRIVDGETLVFATVTGQQQFQLHDDLAAAGIRSVLLTPLVLEGRVIGILGAYCSEENRFDEDHSDFFRLAAELVAIAIENARAYEEIERLMRERSHFMLQVAHNMRAPLAASLGILDLLTGGYVGELDERQHEILGRVNFRLRDLNQAIGELLNLARTRDASRPITPTQVDVSELAIQLERTFAEEAERKSLDFSVTAAEGIPPVHSEGDLLKQIMENLVSNAIKYTQPGGRVTVGFSLGKGRRLHVEVSDTGIGVPSRERDRLFTEFYRASNARQMEAIGSGLGLALVKEAVERHRGQVALNSEEGRGTTVTIDLPLGTRPRTMGKAAG
jgi:signal transduction histidine kinase